jgi:hypothetical protein
MTSSEGLYVSYNEGDNGSFEEAVDISNRLGCVTWLDRSPLTRERLHYPTQIFVRLTGQERYFRGILLAIAQRDDLPDLDGERNHRPRVWQERDPQVVGDFKSVLFISRLEEVSKPPEIENLAAPQRPTYVNLVARPAG